MEVGAGEFVPTIRRMSERILDRATKKGVKTHLIRINPSDQDTAYISKTDPRNVIIDENSTQKCIEDAESEEKLRSIIKVRASAKDAIG